MFKVVIGHTEDPDSQDAVSEIIEQCEKNLKGEKPKAGILLASTLYDTKLVLKEVEKHFPGIELIGCTTCAEISSVKGYMEGSLVLVLFCSDTIEMKATVVRDLSKKDIKSSVKQALDAVLPTFKKKPTFSITTPDVLSFDSMSLIKEIQNILGENFPILGGGSSDPWKFTEICQFYQTEVLHDAAPILFFSEPLIFASGVASGWTPFTSLHKLEEVEKNVALTISNKKALQFYVDYLGGSPTLIHPLAIYEKDDENFYLRAPLASLEDKGAIVFTGELHRNSNVRISKADHNSIIEAAIKAYLQAMNKYPNQEFACAFMTSCACRRQILGSKTRQEYETIKEKILQSLPLFGFYSLGQFGPYTDIQKCVWHIETIVFTLIGEKNAAG